MRARSWSVFVATIAAGVIGIVLLPGAAWADGDPASDVLLGQNVFYPYSPPVSASLQRTLDTAAAAARRAGFSIKVALIASPVDLGVVPDLFGKPQKYAAFLDQEISFNVKQSVLVVMPAGFGGAGLPAPAAAALAGLPSPSGAKSDDLARAAIQAVPKLAAAAGHSFKAPGVGNGSGGSASSSGGTSAVVFAAPLLLVALAVAFMTLRSRQARGPSG